MLSHLLVPKYEIASEKEVAEVLERHRITKQNLPWIKSTDVAVAALEAKAGDVLKIKRVSPTTGKEVAYYRLVVE